MKKYILLLAVSLFAACTPGMKTVDLESTIPVDKVTIAATKTDVLNVYEFSSNVTDAALAWDLGNGTKVNGSNAQGLYPFKGEYKITLTVLSQGGMTTQTTTINITEDNYDLVNDPLYTMVSGGIDVLEGKTWVIDSLTKGHLGCGDVKHIEPIDDWWSAPILDKSGWGIYDDEINFTLKGAKFTYKNNGDSFVNADAVNEAKARGASIINQAGDAKMAYTPGTNLTWSISKEGGKNYIKFPAGEGFAIYWTLEPHKYEIRSINDDEMYLMAQYPGIRWFVKLIRKGVVRPVEPPKPPVEKPYKSIDINVSFDNDPTPEYMIWDKGSSKNFSVVNNMPIGINTSAKVGMYERGASEWCALTTDLKVKLDLTNRNIFTIKAFYPSGNKYEGTVATDHFDKTITMRLQNAESNEPWMNEASIALPVTKFDQWVQYTFDFSAFKDMNTLSRITLQFGGEPKFVDGTFFFDDLILK